MQAADLLERIRNGAMPGGALECKGTWVRQEGEMRLGPDRPWLPFTAEQWFPGNGIDFHWTDKGEAMRGLAELPWRPFAFRERLGLAWKTTGTNKVRAAFDDGKTQAAVEFEVDDDGHVLGGFAPDRPRGTGKSVIETAWSGVFTNYRMFDGVRVPSTAEASWNLDEGPFTYWRGRVTEFRVIR